MNKGLDPGSEDVVCFLNSDDCYAASNVLSQVARQMQAHALVALMGEDDVSFYDKANPHQVVRRYRSKSLV